MNLKRRQNKLCSLDSKTAHLYCLEVQAGLASHAMADMRTNPFPFITLWILIPRQWLLHQKLKTKNLLTIEGVINLTIVYLLNPNITVCLPLSNPNA